MAGGGGFITLSDSYLQGGNLGLAFGSVHSILWEDYRQHLYLRMHGLTLQTQRVPSVSMNLPFLVPFVKK